MRDYHESLFLSAAVILVLLCHTASASADVITLKVSGAFRTPIRRMLPAFEKKTGHKVNVTYPAGPLTKLSVTKGEPFDVAIVQPPFQEMLASGNVVASSQTPLPDVPFGVAVRKGAPKPDISTPEAVKRLLLTTKSIAVATGDTTAAVIRLRELLKNLGMTEDSIKSKFVPPVPGDGSGSVVTVASGKAEISLSFVTNITENPGADVVGPLPRSISTPTAHAAFRSVHTKVPEAARALLNFFSSPEAAAAYKASAIEPLR